MAKELSWKPRRLGRGPGAVYCAPGCGRGCTQREHDDAVARAARLTARLGGGWRPRVHENLGWHYAAMSSCGRVMVCEEPLLHKYIAYLGEAHSHAGRWTAWGNTPRTAVANVVAEAKRDMARLGAILVGL